MDETTLQNIQDRFAALRPGTTVDGSYWDVRDHGLALVAEIERLRLICEQAEGYTDLIDGYSARNALSSLLGKARESVGHGD